MPLGRGFGLLRLRLFRVDLTTAADGAISAVASSIDTAPHGLERAEGLVVRGGRLGRFETVRWPDPV